MKYLCLVYFIAVVAATSTGATTVSRYRLTVGIGYVAPFVFLNTTDLSQSTGYIMDLLNVVSTYTNYTYQFTAYFGASNAGVDAVFHQNFTLLAANTAMTNERMNEVRFAYPFMPRGNMLVIPRPSSTENMWQFVKPFSASAWAMILLVVIIFAVLRIFLKVQKQYELKRRKLASISVKSALWSMGRLLNVEEIDDGVGDKLVSLGFVVFSTVILAAYTANLTAFLAQKALNPSLSSIDDISSKHKICTPGGGDTESYVRNVFDQMTAPPKAVYPTDSSDCYNGVVNGTYDALIDAASVASYLVGRPQYCNIMETGDLLHPSYYGFAFSATVPDFVVNNVSATLSLLKETGTLDKLQSKWWGDSSQCPPAILVGSNDPSLGVDSFWGLLAVVAIFTGFGAIVATATTVYERIFTDTFERRMTWKQQQHQYHHDGYYPTKPSLSHKPDPPTPSPYNNDYTTYNYEYTGNEESIVT